MASGVTIKGTAMGSQTGKATKDAQRAEGGGMVVIYGHLKSYETLGDLRGQE